MDFSSAETSPSPRIVIPVHVNQILVLALAAANFLAKELQFHWGVHDTLPVPLALINTVRSGKVINNTFSFSLL